MEVLLLRIKFFELWNLNGMPLLILYSWYFMFGMPYDFIQRIDVLRIIISITFYIFL